MSFWETQSPLSRKPEAPPGPLKQCPAAFSDPQLPSSRDRAGPCSVCCCDLEAHPLQGCSKGPASGTARATTPFQGISEGRR